MIVTKHRSNSSRLKLATLGATLLVSACTNTKLLNDKKATVAAELAEESLIQGDVPGWRNPLLARAVNYAVQALIADLKSARNALGANELRRAESYLAAAKDLAEGIRVMMPFSVIIDQIRDAKDNFDMNAELFETDTLLPIYQNLEEMEVYAPELAAQSRDKVGRAEKSAKTGNNMQAIEMLDQVETDLSVATVYVPVNTVSQLIENATAALRSAPSNGKVAKDQIDKAIGSINDEIKMIPTGQ